jgi:hypothetical protein
MQEIPAKPRRDLPQPDPERALQGTPRSPTTAGGSSASSPEGPEPVEGDGGHTGARRYRESVQRPMEQGSSEKLADEAAEALDGPEGADSRHAQRAEHGAPVHPRRGAAREPKSGRSRRDVKHSPPAPSQR